MAANQQTGKQNQPLDQDMGKQQQTPSANPNRVQRDSDFDSSSRESADTTSTTRPSTGKQQSDSSIR